MEKKTGNKALVLLKMCGGLLGKVFKHGKGAFGLFVVVQQFFAGESDTDTSEESDQPTKKKGGNRIVGCLLAVVKWFVKD